MKCKTEKSQSAGAVSTEAVTITKLDAAIFTGAVVGKLYNKV